MRAASLSLVLLTVFSPAQSRLSAQTLSDVEISAGYCFGVVDTMIRAWEALEKSHTHQRQEISKGMEATSKRMEEISKQIREFQEIERHRPLTKIETALYDSARALYESNKKDYNLTKEMLSLSITNEEKYPADRDRIRLYLMAKGLFSPSRALDFPALLVSINRGKADYKLCDNELGNEPAQSCMWKCTNSYLNDARAENACYEGCEPPSCKRQHRCSDITWLPF